MFNRSLSFFCLVFLFSCASSEKDSLKYSKKLIKEGHASLYQNGAFQVPTTKIKLIPPGPDAMELAKEMSGVKAKSSFLAYLREIEESVVVIYQGGKATYGFSKKVNENLDRGMRELQPILKNRSKIIMTKSQASGLGIVGSSWEFSKKTYSQMVKYSDEMRKTFKRYSKDVGASFDESIVNTKAESDESIRKMRKDDQGKRIFGMGWENFIRGYVSLPKKLNENMNQVQSKASLEKFAKNFEKSEELRGNYSGTTTYLMGDAFRNYAKDVSTSFNKAGQELDSSSDDIGYTVPVLKALVWLLDGLVWQGVVKPVTKATVGAMGFVLVNGVAYPVILLSHHGATTTQVAVEVAWQSSKSIYEIVAPSAELGLAAILGTGYVTLQQLAKGSTQASQPLITGMLKTAKVFSKAAIDTSGIIVSGTTAYIGAPIAASSIAVSGLAGGVAVGLGGATLAGATRATGDVMGLSSKIVAGTVATSIFAGGLAYHTIKGTAEVVYEIGKAATVPPGQILGGGLVLTYGSLVQLSAQSVLVVSDAAYVVLSLEGPKWVLYAVKGNLGKNEDPREGTMLDLEKMQKHGEEFYRVPVTDEEMKGVIKAIDGEELR